MILQPYAYSYAPLSVGLRGAYTPGFGFPVRVFSRRLRSELQRLARLPWLSVAGHDSLSGARPPPLSVLAYSASSIVLLPASATRRCRAASKSITLPAMAALSDSTLFHIGM